MRQAGTRLAATMAGVMLLTLSGISGIQAQSADDRAFTATAVQTMPDGTEQVGAIMKSGQNMRMEMQAEGQSVIQIMRGGEGLAYMIDPQSRTYVEIQDPSVARAVEGASSPCPTAEQMQGAGIRCEQVGQGKISGIITQTWEIQAPQDQGPTIAQWDTGRRRALAQSWPDGTELMMTFQAMQDIEGRSVEYWTSSFQAPDQPAALGGWWFDSTLRVVVREEIPGGVTRALTDIRTGPVDPAQFLPPEGYQAVDPQALQPQNQAPASQ